MCRGRRGAPGQSLQQAVKTQLTQQGHYFRAVIRAELTLVEVQVDGQIRDELDQPLGTADIGFFRLQLAAQFGLHLLNVLIQLLNAAKLLQES